MNTKDLNITFIRETLESLRSTALAKHPSAFLWQQSLSIDNQFCESVVNAGFLTHEQMVHASARYCIGASKRGGVIFWQIDHEGRVHDGKVMYYLPNCHRNKDKAAHPTWVSSILAYREAKMTKSLNLETLPLPPSPSAVLPSPYSIHCFFGLHLLTSDLRCKKEEVKSVDISFKSSESSLPSIAIVESEKSAFILSELYPQHIWLASGGLGEVQLDKFHPLRRHKVVMFPDTDPDGIAYRKWSIAAEKVMRAAFWEDSAPIRVSPLLELHATDDQKQRKIDLVDFIFELNTNQPKTL